MLYVTSPQLPGWIIGALHDFVLPLREHIQLDSVSLAVIELAVPPFGHEPAVIPHVGIGAEQLSVPHLHKKSVAVLGAVLYDAPGWQVYFIPVVPQEELVIGREQDASVVQEEHEGSFGK